MTHHFFLLGRDLMLVSYVVLFLWQVTEALKIASETSFAHHTATAMPPRLMIDRRD